MDTRTRAYLRPLGHPGELRVGESLYRGTVHKVYADENFTPEHSPEAIFAVFDRVSGAFVGLVSGETAQRAATGAFGQLLSRPFSACCRPDESLRQAWTMLQQEPLGMLAVTDAQDAFQGVITRDSAVEALLERVSAAARRNRDTGTVPLSGMYEAARSLLQSLGRIEDEELLAQRGLRLLMTLLNARYGAISIADERGALQRFIHDGLSEAQAKRIAHPPEGKGLLGVVLREGEVLRLKEIRHDPRSAGFPPHHPAMTTLLAVPIAYRREIIGRLYLCDRLDGRPFSKDDEILARTFADQLALMTLGERQRQRAHAAQIETARLLAENRQLARRLLTAQEEERRYLARELHNELAQYITAMRTEAQRLILLAGNTAPVIQEGATALSSLCERTHDLAREVLRGLAPTLVYETGLADALRELVESYKRHHGRIRFRLVTAGRLESLDSQVAIAAYRVVQEALTNTVRHAAPTTVFVGVRRPTPQHGMLRISVRDNGCGFELKTVPNALGLIGMRERVQALDGELRVRSRPGGGTHIEARIPVTDPGEKP